MAGFKLPNPFPWGLLVKSIPRLEEDSPFLAAYTPRTGSDLILPYIAATHEPYNPVLYIQNVEDVPQIITMTFTVSDSVQARFGHLYQPHEVFIYDPVAEGTMNTG